MPTCALSETETYFQQEPELHASLRIGTALTLKPPDICGNFFHAVLGLRIQPDFVMDLI